MVDSIALVAIGFLIYGPVMLIGLHALDLAPKKAAGTAAGLTGFFGYLGGAAFASRLWALSWMHSDGMADSSYYLHLVYLQCSSLLLL